MADKGGKTLPGPLYIEVEYDYEYETKDKKIVIKQGERYILVKKTNDDWWQVKKDENSKPFYVPAQYVKEVARKALMPPIKQPGGLPNSSLKLMHGLQRSTENVNKSPELSSFGKSSPVQVSGLVRDANQNLGPNASPGQMFGLSLDLTQNNGKLNSELHSPKVFSQNRTFSMGHFPCTELMEIEKTSFLHEQSCDSAGESSEKIHQDSESGDELSSSSTEQPTTPPSQGRPESPVYANLQELKISQSTLPPLPASSPIQTNGEWETHKDTTGRCYYYNRGTQERTWKPPRWTRDASINKGDSQNQADHEGQEKYGLLNVTKITENGKKVRKNWMSSWAVLQGSSLLFTKTQGSGTSWFGVNQSKPEFTVDLRGAIIEWASKDKSSKKNVIELKTRQGTELLIQSDNDSLINEWYKVLNYTINNQAVESDEALEDDVPDSPGVEKQDKEKDHKDSKKLRCKFCKPFSYNLSLISDQVFGSILTSLCQRENSTVPKFVKLCIEHVEEHGLDVDGLYRVSGNLAVIQKLRFAVNHDEKLDLNDSKWEDIHVITGALKMFFRELPEPLFTYNHFNDFVNMLLVAFLKRNIRNDKNRMTYQSVAIVFGPTLLKPEKETGNIAVHTVYQNQIVELILLELNSIFGH
uniref:Rho GTPase activating protein 12 n=1 Tax=Sphenodon punctatus TaxID=8508 RepID=A0A8D0GLW9_SPHPU